MSRYLLFLPLLLIFTSLCAQDTTQFVVADSIEKVKHAPAPVIFNYDTLFIIKGHLGPFTPHDRAVVLTKRIKELSGGLEFDRTKFETVEIEGLVSITYENKVLLSIGSKDTIISGESRHEMAQNRLDVIALAIEESRNLSSVKNWPVRLGLALLWLAGFILIIFLINRFFKWINTKVHTYEKKLKRKRLNILRYLTPRGPEYFSTFLLRIGKILIIVLFILAYLPWIFTLFPVTQRIVRQFYGYIADPLKAILIGIYEFLPSLFFIVIIFLAARYFVRVLTLLSSELENEKIKISGFHKDWAKPTLNIFRILIYAFALIFMFPHIPGSNSPAFQGVSIFFGVLLSLGSTSAIANIVAGVVITYMRPFVIGDRVKISNTVGDVVEKSLLVTRIRTLKNEDVTIPNATIINNHLWNYSKNAKEIGLILYTSVTIGYDVPSVTVNKLLVKAATNTSLIQRSPKPFVLHKLLGDHSVEYEINAYTKQAAKMPQIYSDLHNNILSSFQKAGIEILSPKYIASRDGNATTIHETVEPAPKDPVEQVIDQVTGKNQKVKGPEKK